MPEPCSQAFSLCHGGQVRSGKSPPNLTRFGSRRHGHRIHPSHENDATSAAGHGMHREARRCLTRLHNCRRSALMGHHYPKYHPPLMEAAVLPHSSHTGACPREDIGSPSKRPVQTLHMADPEGKESGGER
jgi:hypothetical protein